MEQQDDLKYILNRRSAPPAPSSDLADRIIHAAMRTPRDEKKTIWQIIANIMNPPMRYAVGLACLILFIAVTYTPQTHTQDDVLTDYEFTMVLDVYDDEQWL